MSPTVRSVAMARATAVAIGTPSMPHRVDREWSATAMTVAVLGCSNSRMMMGAKFVSEDCAQSIDAKRSPGLPVAQADKIEACSMRPAAVIAHRDVGHTPQDEQLDRGDVGQADERGALWRGNLPGGHGIGTRSMTSLMTASVVRPWLAACGPSQMRCERM